jgi:hypothetical protein
MLNLIKFAMVTFIVIALIISRQQYNLPTYMEGYIIKKGTEELLIKDNFSNRKITLKVYYVIIRKNENHEEKKWYVNDYTYFKFKDNEYVELDEDNLHTAWEQE